MMGIKDKSRLISGLLLGAVLMLSYQNCGDNNKRNAGRSTLFENHTDLSCEQMKYVPVEMEFPATIAVGQTATIKIKNGNMFMEDTMLLQLGDRYCDIVAPDPSICSVSTEGTSVVVRTSFVAATTQTMIFSAFDYCRYGRAKIESICVSGPGNSCPLPTSLTQSLAGACTGKKQSMESCSSSDQCCSNNCVENKCMPSSVSVVK